MAKDTTPQWTRQDADGGTASATEPEAVARSADGKPEQADDPTPSTDDLLAEFDAAVPTPAPAGAGAKTKPTERAGETDGSADLRVDGLIDLVRTQQLQRLQDEEVSDARKVLNDAKKPIAEFAGKLPDDFAERWLMSEYQLNARLHNAWNRRRDDPAAMARAERAIERALNDLYKAAERAPSAEATADADAVVAALRGASATQPKARAPDYGRITDGEFRRAVEDEHGYSPSV